MIPYDDIGLEGSSDTLDLSLGVGLVTRKGLLTAPKCVTAAGYHPHLINTHIYKVGEVNHIFIRWGR